MQERGKWGGGESYDMNMRKVHREKTGGLAGSQGGDRRIGRVIGRR